MSRSELFIVMTGGMATIAGTVFALYVTLLEGIIPDPAGHVLTASIISAPAAIMIALILVPRTGEEVDDARVEFKRIYENGADALTRGTFDGLRLFPLHHRHVDCAGGVCRIGEYNSRPRAAGCRRAADAAENSRLDSLPGSVGAGRTLGGISDCLATPRHESDPQRACSTRPDVATPTGKFE